jgi:hypothetical protein
MADLPRYQSLGVQVADLPKISTAPQQVASQGFSSLAQNLDRMLSYAEDAATTEAKQQAVKYAVENPPTREQLNTAMKEPESLKVAGAGRVFQDTYQKTLAQSLSTDLQLEASAELTNITNQFQVGKLSMQQAKQKMVDLMDGQSALMVSVSPEVSLSHRGTMATMANTVFKKISDIERDTFLGIEKAKYETSLNGLTARIEDIIKYQSGSIDPQTGKPVDIGLMIAAEMKPYAESVRKLNGDNTYYSKALELSNKAKVGALQALANDKKFAPSPGVASQKFQNGDYGKLTPIYNSLSQDQKNELRQKTVAFFSDVQTARDLGKRAEDNANDQSWRVLSLELVNPATTMVRREEITRQGIRMGKVNVMEAGRYMAPVEGPGNSTLYGQLIDQVNRKLITSTEGATKYQDQLSANQYASLVTAINSDQGKDADSMLRRRAGTKDNIFATQDNRAIETRLLSMYTTELQTYTLDPNGVKVYKTPVEAAESTIKRYDSDKTVIEKAKKQENAKVAIETALKERGITLPTNLPIDQIEFNQYKNLSKDLIDDLKKQQEEYRKNQIR